MNADEFFDLLNNLHEYGTRPRIEPGSARWDIITIRPEDRVLQILAGPGSGKTESLVSRILYELFVVETPAERLLVTTFTRKAATELEIRLVERCDALLEHADNRGTSVRDPRVHDVRIGTLHSLCDRLLADFDDEYTERGTRLIDEHETLVRLARAYRFDLGAYTPPGQSQGPMAYLNGVDGLAALFRPPWDSGRWPSSTMERVVFAQNLLAQHTETWVPRCADTGINNGAEHALNEPGLTGRLSELHDKWLNYLEGQEVLDFTTIQETFLARQASLLDKFAHVFVDEFQDTNPIQAAIHMRWLEHGATRLTVVGDDDQSIYRFRGSDIGSFTGLQGYCDNNGIGYRQEKLEENWRSTRAIANCGESFRRASALSRTTMSKTVRPAPAAADGPDVRLLTGPWSALCDVMAAELASATNHLASSAASSPSEAAVLLFSTSEKSSQNQTRPADQAHRALA